MKVPRYNYPDQFGNDIETLLADVRSMLLGGNYILTSHVDQFERAFSAYCGCAYGVGVNSGTDALILALAALGVGRGDEVITAANTFYATVAAIRLIGATPVLVDADPRTFLIDERQLPAAITARTKVLLPVHLFGQPCRMDQIMKLAQAHGLAVVEDAAQAHGARFQDRSVGSFGSIGCFSFHPSKNLAAAGDAGMLVTNDRQIDDYCRQARALGQQGQNNHVILGGNSKLDAIQARVLLQKLPNMEVWNERRRQIASLYRERLAETPVEFQCTADDELHVYHLLQIRTSHRDALQKHLISMGVDAVTRYPQPIHRQAAFVDCGWKAGQFPNAEALCNELLCLPIRPDMSCDEVDYVCDQVKIFFGDR